MPGLFGEEFEITLEKPDIKDILKRAEGELSEADAKKVLKSKSITLQERLSFISENVLRVLGRQKLNIKVVTNIDEFSAYIDAALEVGCIAVDTETNNSTDAYTCQIMGLCLYVPGKKQIYVPINHTNVDTNERLSYQLTEKDIKEQLSRLVISPNKPNIIMHNGKFDYEVLKCTCGLQLAPTWDTLVAARIIDENVFADKKVSLKYIYTTYIDPTQTKYSIDALFEGTPYRYVDPDIFALYAATDSLMTYRVYEWEMEYFNKPENAEQLKLMEQIEIPSVEVTAETELYGVEIDQEEGKRLKIKYDKQLEELDTQIAQELDNLKDLISAWRLSYYANSRGKIYQSSKSKMSLQKAEETYTFQDEKGRKYKLGKPMISQLEDPINLASPTQLAILFYDILLRQPADPKNPRATGEDEIKFLDDALVADLEDLDEMAEATVDTLLSMEESAKKQAEEQAKEKKEKEHMAGFEFYTTAKVKQFLPDRDKLIELYKQALPAAHNLCKALLVRRGIVKLITTYIDVIPALAKHWPDGRIRYRLNSTGTDTGRFASGGKFKFLDENDNPVEMNSINSQNIPSHNPEIRTLFRAPKGRRIVGSDYSGQELRLAAYLSQDPTLLKAYADGKDAYAIIASMIFDMPYEDCLEFYPEGTEIEIDGKKIITGKKTHTNKAGKERRSVGKTMVLAGNYGMSGGGAASLMGKTAKEGTELLEKYFKMFGGLGNAIVNAKKFLREHGYVEGLLGRRRRLPDLFLPKYEIYLKDNDDAKNFNPFIGCENRLEESYSVKYWKEVLAEEIQRSDEWQRSKDPAWKSNGEISNACYTKMAIRALHGEKHMRQEYRNGKKVWYTKEPTQKLEPVIIQANTGRIAQAERQCFNALIQGSAGTLTKKAMIDIYKDPQLRAWDTHLIISVHDEVLVECPEEYAEQVEKRLPEIMINAAIELGITAPAMKCDPYNVSRWYADSAAVSIRAEFDKLEKGDEKKGIAPISREEALEKIYENHIEFPKEAIYKAITEGIDLEY